MRAVITTCTQENLPVPKHDIGTGEPGRLTGGELMVTLLVKPVVALQAGPPTSNQVAVKDVPVDVSQPFEKIVVKPLFAAKSWAAITVFEFAAIGELMLP